MADLAPQVIRVDRVAQATKVLSACQVHSHFAGYLALIREAKLAGRTRGLEGKFKEFFDTFLRVDGGPANKPYWRPFWHEGGAGIGRGWYQRNVAGSYAPSSALRIPAFVRVVEIDGDRYALRPDHEALALRYLLYGKRIPILPLVTFLYRNFALALWDPPHPRDLVAVFRREFGFPEEADNGFATMFDDESESANPTEWFELYAPSKDAS
jgi:hypothetical protein